MRGRKLGFSERGDEWGRDDREGRKEMFVSNLSSIFVFICKPYGSVLIVFLLRLFFTFTSLSKPEIQPEQRPS